MIDKGQGNAEHRARGLEEWKRGDLNYFTIDQGWEKYTVEEHGVWRTLYERQQKVLPGRAVPVYLDCMKALDISADKIPDFRRINDILMAKTGWQVVGVPGLIPDEPFFELLANRRFPAGTFIRRPDQLDYIQEPDVFHDMFGHVPLLSHPVFADYLERFGRGGMKAAGLDAINEISRLYWFTVEFGLMKTDEGLRIYGSGILSSPRESVFSLDDPSPNRIGFDLKRIMRTLYRIDDFQESYFVIDSFEQLYGETAPDFTPIYKEIKKQEPIARGVLLDNDAILHNGTGEYHREKYS